MLQNPQEVIQNIEDKRAEQNHRKGVVGIIKSVIDDAKSFFNGLADKTSKDLKDNTFKVTVENQLEPPKVQGVSGTVEIKNAREYVIGLNEIKKGIESQIKAFESATNKLSKDLKPEKADFSSLEKAVKSIKIPETKIPEYPKSIEINNLSELKKEIAQLKKAIDSIKIPEVKIPEFPRSVEISNLPEEKEIPEEEKMIGLDWITNELGDVATLIEHYPSGDVVSTGWAIGRVSIDDRRN